jgi:hypothetical protein
MNWFGVLKNQARTINLPKFKVKPFNVNKPDEDDDCERKVKEIEDRFNKRDTLPQSERDELENRMKQSKVFNVRFMYRWLDETRQLMIQVSPKSEKYSGADYLRFIISHTNTKIQGQIIPFADSKLNEEVYCEILDLIQRDKHIEPKKMDNVVIEYRTNDLFTGDYEGDFEGLFMSAGSFDRMRELVVHPSDYQISLAGTTVKMSSKLKVRYRTSGAMDTFLDEMPHESFLDLEEYILLPLTNFLNAINIKFTE